MDYGNVSDLTGFLCPQDWDIHVIFLESVLGQFGSEEPEVIILHAHTH